MKAIALPYTIEQNEPSKPLSKIIELPDDIGERDRMLVDLFCEHVCEVDEDERNEITVRRRQTEDDYGDLIVAYNDMFLFLTYLK